MAGTLFVVATPIGHLEDITLRALRVLKSVALVAAEDTRRTGNLLRHYDINTPILSVHEHNEDARVPRVLGRLEAGDSVALVTDARLVAAVRSAGFRVEPVPGASAVVTALSAAGVSSDGFVFLGFPPIRPKDRTKWFTSLVELSRDRAVVFFEAPHRVRKTLQELVDLVKWPIMAGRELTKIHEELRFGLPPELLEAFPAPQGEFTFVVPPQVGHGEVEAIVDDGQIVDAFGQITETVLSGSKRDAARAVAERLGLTTRQVYEAMERHKLGQ